MDPVGLGIGALTATASGVAALHTLAPDHWMPFAAMGRAQGWSRARLVGTTAAAGLAHVGSSIALGGVGLALGYAVDALQIMQSSRGHVALYVLIAFGVAYALWGLWRARRWRHAHSHGGGAVHAHPHTGAHRHSGSMAARRLTTWTIVLVFVLGPCEPLIPIMFAGFAYGWWGVAAPVLAFGLTTVSLMIVLALLASAGFTLVRPQWLERYVHATSGVAIAATGMLVLVLGI